MMAKINASAIVEKLDDIVLWIELQRVEKLNLQEIYGKCQSWWWFSKDLTQFFILNYPQIDNAPGF